MRYTAALMLLITQLLGRTPAPLGGRLALDAACLQLVEGYRLFRNPLNGYRVAPYSSSCAISSESRNLNITEPCVPAHLPVRQLGTSDSARLRNQYQKHRHSAFATTTMKKTALVALANGAEDVEFIAPVDILRRAGVKVVVASIGDSLMIKTAQGVRIEGEITIKDVSDSEHFDIIILPGGMKGAENCRDCPHLTKLLKSQHEAGRWIGAICASPAVVLNHHGFLDDVKAVGYPSFQDQLKHKGKGRVCVDKHFITSMGPGSAIEFGMEIVKHLVGEAKRDELMKGMCVV